MNTTSIPTTNPFDAPESTPTRARRSPLQIAALVVVVAIGWAGGWAATSALLHHGGSSPAAAPSTWQPVLLDGSSSVRMPAGAEHTTRSVEIAGRDVAIDLWQAHSGDVQYVASRSALDTSGDASVLLHGAAAGAFSKMRVDAPVLQSTTVAGAPALRGDGSVDGHSVHAVFVWRSGTLYQFIAAAPSPTMGDFDAYVGSISMQ